jgi:hypothetical protein
MGLISFVDQNGAALAAGLVIRFRYRGLFAFGRIRDGVSYQWLGDHRPGDWPEGVDEAIAGVWKGDSFVGRGRVRPRRRQK